MARPPAGPIGNSPRDVRDDAVGVPAENVNAPEPPRWPPKPKKITKNTFHAKVSGGKAPKRADRAPHFRKGGWVSGYAAGGSVEERREEKPGENKNDPFAKQNLKGGGGVAKRKGGGDVEGGFSDKVGENRLIGASATRGSKWEHDPYERSRRERLFEPMGENAAENLSWEKAKRQEHYAKGGGVKKKASGGAVKRQEGGSIGAGLQAARDRGTVEARKIMRGAPLRSESTERARALSRADQDLTNRAAGGRGMPREERDATLQTFKETGEYKSGGKVSK
jgi:hypothetical protein